MENSNTKYRIIFAGKVREGEDLSLVKARMASLFKVDAAVIEKIFREVPYMLLRNQGKERALKYKQAFDQTGAFCRIEVEEPLIVAEPGASREAKTNGRPGVQRIDKAALKSFGGGLVITVGVLLIPFLSYVFHYMLTLVHELGHAIFGWFFGYPSLPAFDFMYGGGLTSHQDRKMIIVVIVFLLLAGLFVLFRKNILALLFLSTLVVLYAIFVFTPGHQLIILFMGHGSELVFGAIFLYRALSGSSILVPAERPLYAFLGFFVLFMDLRFAHRLMTSDVYRAEYGAAKGGGHWMDFSRIANEILSVDLTTVASFFFLLCVLSPIAAYLFFRYKEYLASFFKRLLVIR